MTLTSQTFLMERAVLRSGSGSRTIATKSQLESELATDTELTRGYNVGTEEAYPSNETVQLINDALELISIRSTSRHPSTGRSTTRW